MFPPAGQHSFDEKRYGTHLPIYRQLFFDVPLPIGSPIVIRAIDEPQTDR